LNRYRIIALLFALGVLLVALVLLSTFEPPLREPTQDRSPQRPNADAVPSNPTAQEILPQPEKPGRRTDPEDHPKQTPETETALPATSQLKSGEWDRIRNRSGLSITPRREFIRAPKPVRVDFSSLQAGRDRIVNRLNFDLGLSVPVIAKVESIDDYSPRAYSLTGKIEGDPFSEFSLSVYEDAAVATFHSSEFGIRQLRYVGAGIHRVETVDAALAPGCAVGKTQSPVALSASLDDENSTGITSSSGPPPPTTSPDSLTPLDVLVAYTPAAVNNEGSLNALLALIHQGVTNTNQIFANSKIDAHLRLVGTTEVSYTGNEPQAMLGALIAAGDGSMDTVHGERDQMGADFVSLWSPLSNYCGLAAQLQDAGPQYAHIAFSVVDPDCQFKHTFTHELGHNFGCHHALGDAGQKRYGALFDYSFAWRWGGANSKSNRSVMAYSPGSVSKFFSNPQVSHNGHPTGRVDLEDNARSINEAKGFLSQYRDSTIPPVDDHGNTTTDATRISQNATIEGELETDSDRDVFRFTLTSDSSLITQKTVPPGARVELRNSSGSIIFSGNSSGSVFVPSLPFGTYYLTVFAENAATGTGDYTLSLSTSNGSGNGDDHGGTVETATGVSTTANVDGELEFGGDKDYFKINVSIAGTLKLSTNAYSETRGSLINAEGNTIKSNNNSDYGNFYIERSVSPGTYYVLVRGKKASTTSNYQLYVRFEPVPDDHSDYYADGTIITVPGDGITNGSFEVPNDVDYFRINVTEGAVLDIYTTGDTDTHGRLETTIYDCFNTTTIVHAENDNGGSGGNFRILHTMLPGSSVDLRVKSNSGIGGGDYELHVDATLLPDDHGSSFESATRVDPGIWQSPTMTRGKFDFVGDPDFFRFTIGDPVEDPYSGSNVTVALDFDGPPAPPTNGESGFDELTEDGFILFAGPSTKRLGEARNNYPSNGSPSVIVSGIDLTNGTRIEAANGKVFTPKRVDIAEYSTFYEGRTHRIYWTGYKLDGSTVMHDFEIDGIIDGPYGVDDFETFNFPDSFANIITLECNYRCAFDNLVVKGKAGPVPGTGYFRAFSQGESDTRAQLFDSRFRAVAGSSSSGYDDNFLIARELPFGVYYLKVSKQLNDDGNAYTVQSGFGLAPPPQATPQDLTATTEEPDGVQLTWPSAEGALFYNIYRDGNQGIAEPALLAAGVNRLSHFDHTTEPGQTYRYWITANNGFHDSPLSAQIVGRRPGTSPTITAHPADVGVISGGSATFTAEASTDFPPLSYQWYRGARGDRSHPVGTDSPTLTLWNLNSETQVWVNVANRFAGGSTDSEGAKAYLMLPPPEKVSATRGLSTSRITLRWLAVPGAVSYQIFRNTNDTESGATLLGSTESPQTSFGDSTALAGQDYYYFVRSVDVNGVVTSEGHSAGGASGNLADAPLDGSFVPVNGVVDFVYSIDGSHLYIADQAGGLDSYSLSAKEVINSVAIGHPLSGIDVNPTRASVLAAQGDATAGIGKIHELDLSEIPATHHAVEVPLQNGETGMYDVVHLSADKALASVRSPGTTGLLREIDLVDASSLTRPVAGTPNGKVASDTFFSRQLDRSAVFQSSLESAAAEWFSIDPVTGQFGPVRSHPHAQRCGAVNAVGSMYAVVDDSETTLYDHNGEALTALPLTGGVAFSPLVDQLYIVDENTDTLRTFSTRTWSEQYSLPIEGEVESHSDSVIDRSRLQIRPDGLQAAVACRDGIRFFDISSQLPSQTPLPPASLSIGDQPYDDIKLHWIGSTGATHYHVYRGDSAVFSQSTLLAENIEGSTFLDAVVSIGQVYYYWVVAANDHGTTAPGPMASATLLEYQPYQLSATRNLTGQVRISWEFDGDSAYSFELFRSTDNQVTNAVLIASPDLSYFIDTDVADATSYHYWVRARFSPSLVGDFTGPTIGHSKLPRPANVSATTTLGSKVTITWQASPNATEYEVYAGSNFAVEADDRLVGVTPNTSIDDLWSNFPAGRPFYWAVRAKAGDVVSQLSPGAFGRRTLVPPIGVVATSDSLDAIRLTWTHRHDSHNEYAIYRSLTNDIANATQVTRVSVPTSYWSDENTTANTPYYYWVQAIRSSGGTLSGEFSTAATGLRIGGKWTDYVDEFALTGDQAILTNDPDSDGMLTIEEWALGGTSPLTASERPPLLLRDIDIAGQIFPGLCHLRLVGGTQTANQYDAVELRYVVQASSGRLDHWDLVPIATAPPADLPQAPAGYEWACHRLPGSIKQYPNGFLRLKISLPGR